jgi:cation:H+ antiporter
MCARTRSARHAAISRAAPFARGSPPERATRFLSPADVAGRELALSATSVPRYDSALAMMDAGYVLAGLALLYFGAEWLVGGAARLAASFGVRPLIVGLTVVAYGTSSPELVVGIGAAARGQGDIALGNVVGSNIANIGLILAVAALIRPPAIDLTLRRREVPVLLVTAGLVPITLLDGSVEAWEGATLLVLGALYTAWMARTSRDANAKQAARDDAEEMAAAADRAALGAVPARGRLRLLGIIAAGLALLVGGGHLLVEGAVGIARTLGMSDRLIGLTLIAVGTSLPELATSVIAAVRGHSDIAVGNVVGSNIFNVLLILGASGLVGTIHAPLHTLRLDLVALGAMTVLAAIVIATRRRVSRLEATLLLLGYVAFLFALIAAP